MPPVQSLWCRLRASIPCRASIGRPPLDALLDLGQAGRIDQPDRVVQQTEGEQGLPRRRAEPESWEEIGGRRSE